MKKREKREREIKRDRDEIAVSILKSRVAPDTDLAGYPANIFA